MTVDQNRDTDLPSDTTEFGVDEQGRTHRYSRIEHTVFVSDGNEYDLHETPLTTLGDWCDHVRGVCGWRELDYAGDEASGWDALADKAATVSEVGP